MNSYNDILLNNLKNAIQASLNAPFYQVKFDQYLDLINAGINIDNIRLLPFTTKEELRNNDPLSFLCTPFSKVRRLHSSSGTKGNPTNIFHSDNDLNLWYEHLFRAFKMAGLEAGDVFQTIVGFGLFSGGLGFEQAAERYGMTVIPIGTGNTEKQVEYLRKFKVNGIVTISSYLTILVDYLINNNIDPKKELYLKSILIGAEPFNLSQREKYKAFFGVPILSVYGMAEMEGPGVAAECQFEGGMHLFHDSFYPEIIDPKTLLPMQDGEEGELVLTSLQRECMPLIRYRTGDITKIHRGSCNCLSKYELKIDYVKHRIDDMFIVKGVNIYPFQIQNIILSHKEIEPFLQILVDEYSNVIINLVKKNETEAFLNVEKRIKKEIKDWLFISVNIQWKDKAFFTEKSGKIQLLIDNRVL